MDFEFKDGVFKGLFRPTQAAYEVEEKLRTRFGFVHRYDAAQLMLGRSLTEAQPPPSLSDDTTFAKPLPGELLFSGDVDLWLCVLILDGKLGVGAGVDDFRRHVEAHWARGGKLLKEDMEACGDNEAQFASLLANYLPEAAESGGATPSASSGKSTGEIRLKVGSVSRTFPADKPVDFALNSPAASPHIALMGRTRSGKTTTGLQIALDIMAKANVPMLLLDPKGEFVTEDGKLQGRLAAYGDRLGSIKVGYQPIPLDFLPAPTVGHVSVQNAAMKLRDAIALCCKSPGDIQQDLLRQAIERVIQDDDEHTLDAVKDAYESELQRLGRDHDSILSRLNELTSLRCFAPEMTPTEFFSRPWVISLSADTSDELKRLIILMLLDSASSWLLSQNDTQVVNGNRSLRHLLVVDEARQILLERKYESLSQLIRRGGSKGSVVMLLSQDPSDFDGQQDDFTTQLGTVISFACNQSARGLKALSGPFGRKLQPNEFTDVTLPQGVAFAKLPGRDPERIKCWEPG